MAFSSGNHAQGVASSAKLFGIHGRHHHAADAPQTKVANTRSYGAEVVFFDRYNESREEVAAPYIEERGMVLVPPYDDPSIMAGQGTIGLELVADADERGLTLTTFRTERRRWSYQRHFRCGEGWLSGTRIWGVEPENFDDLRRSLIAGERSPMRPGIVRSAMRFSTPQPGDLTFPINKHNLAGGIAVSDDAVKAAMRDAANHLKLIVEPGGCVWACGFGERRSRYRRQDGCCRAFRRQCRSRPLWRIDRCSLDLRS